MQIAKVARRYAFALLQMAEEQGSLNKVVEDVQLINNTLQDSRDLVLMLKSPIVKPGDKKEVMHKLFSSKLDELTIRFIDLLIKKNREKLIDQVFAAFREEYNKHQGILEVQVNTSAGLDKKQIKSLKKSLHERTGKKIELEIAVDKSLIGGMAVRIDDTVVDGTIKHKIEQLEHLFSSTSVQ